MDLAARSMTICLSANGVMARSLYKKALSGNTAKNSQKPANAPAAFHVLNSQADYCFAAKSSASLYCYLAELAGDAPGAMPALFLVGVGAAEIAFAERKRAGDCEDGAA